MKGQILLVDDERAQPHHLGDAIFALIALGRVDLGHDLLDRDDIGVFLVDDDLLGPTEVGDLHGGASAKPDGQGAQARPAPCHSTAVT